MKRPWILLVMFFFTLLVRAQTPSVFDVIQQDSAIDLFLTVDWKVLERKKAEKAYLPAEIKMIKPDGTPIEMHLKVRTRGNMRLGICSYPPLKLKFDKEQLAALQLSDMDELDLVHHCHSGDAYDQYLLREFLCYKLYQLISPYHFRVQLVRLHYQDKDGSEAHPSTYAFLVEHDEEIAARFGGRQSQAKTMSKNAIDRQIFLRVCLFEFMIGNTDWYLSTRHNLEFVGIPGQPLLVTIPYDFDYSGLVGAPYAVHHESLKLSSVTVRYYQGWCEDEPMVRNEVQRFLEKKDEILSMPSKIQGMSSKSVEYARSFLEEFFAVIENPKKLDNQVIKHCDRWPVLN